MYLLESPFSRRDAKPAGARRSLPLAVRWFLSIAALIAIAMAVLGWVLIDQQRGAYREQTRLLGQVIAEQLADAAAEPLMADDRFALDLLLSRLRDQPLILAMRVVDFENAVMAHSGDAEAFIGHGGAGRRFVAPIRYQDVPVGQAQILIDSGSQQSDLNDRLWGLVGITLGLILLGGLSAFPLACRLSRPINELARADHALRRGELVELDARHRDDEIGTVTKRFLESARIMARKEQAEMALSRYVSADLAEEILSGRLDRPGGKMVEGSVLFCDIVGFTALSENLAPEQVSALLNDYFRYFTLASASCGGMVDKFIGDCIVIVFGVPHADPDHALHAVVCAALIQSLTEELNQRRARRGLPTVCFRIGINSGHMLAGNLGFEERMQYTVIGDTVNVASRLCDLARPGGILVTGETAGHPGVRGMAHPVAAEPVSVKGRCMRVEPYAIDAETIGAEARIPERLHEIFASP